MCCINKVAKNVGLVFINPFFVNVFHGQFTAVTGMNSFFTFATLKLLNNLKINFRGAFIPLKGQLFLPFLDA